MKLIINLPFHIGHQYCYQWMLPVTDASIPFFSADIMRLTNVYIIIIIIIIITIITIIVIIVIIN